MRLIAGTNKLLNKEFLLLLKIKALIILQVLDFKDNKKIRKTQ